MLNVLNMTKVGIVGNLPVFKFEFEFDNASTLPEKTFLLGQKTYLIAEGSTATNLSTKVTYQYNGVDSGWKKVLSSSSSEPTVTTINNITTNGDYNIINNDSEGYNKINVKVPGDIPSVLTTKNITSNGQYNAEDDNAEGYSTVDVNVPNTYTAGDEGKVVTNQELVAQTAYPNTVTTNNTYDTTNYNSITVDVANTYTNEDEGKVVDDGALVAQTAYPTEITENDTYDTTNYNSITVNVSGGGGGGTGGTDVIFYDYDGTVVTSYSAADFANLSAMPANPTHEGLTAQGWNWSLADAKAYVASYGKLNIGQMYITSDGKTRLYYVIPKDELTLDLHAALDSDTALDVDWGDGSAHTTWTSDDGDSSKSHKYSEGGRYTVAITVTSGGFSYQSSGSTDYTLKKVEFGSNVTSIGESAFRECATLTSITIPSSVTSIGESAFRECTALTSITIPSSVTSIGEYAFYVSTALASVTIPSSITSIGESAFYQCSGLSSITIPSSVKSIGNAAFDMCTALTSITIPSSVTSIGNSVFSNCSALSSITIPSGVTFIGNSVFEYCLTLSSITFESSKPPVLSGDLELSTTCIIRVPQDTLSNYTSEEYYPDPLQYIYEEY